ncbi:ATP-binding protein [Streptomyces sp. NPDC006645]|uniref:ATP-binding protein n=1 Tax=unclassified Streptomyces TaxID=2593676 RepID=UPI00339F4962
MEILAAQSTALSLLPTADRHVWSLPDTDLAQAAHARRKAAGVLERWRLPRATVDDAVLVVCELVTNAIRHGRSPVHIALHRGQGAVTISVNDQGHVPFPTKGPEPDLDFDLELDHGGEPGLDQEHSGECGRGLSIVAALSHAHGYEGGDSTTFWARLHTRPADHG